MTLLSQGCSDLGSGFPNSDREKVVVCWFFIQEKSARMWPLFGVLTEKYAWSEEDTKEVRMNVTRAGFPLPSDKRKQKGKGWEKLLNIRHTLTKSYKSYKIQLLFLNLT